MAKVMISMPDELLASVDAEAERSGRSRSAVLRGFAEEALSDRTAMRIARMKELNAQVPPGGHGGDVVADLRAEREARTTKLARG